MKMQKSLLTMAGVAILAVSGLAVAQSKPPQTLKAATKAVAKAPKIVESVTRGTIVSSGPTELMLEAKKGAKAESFKLDAATVRTGELTTGAKATVHYKMEGADKIVTRVIVSASKPSKTVSSAVKPAKKS